MANAVVFATLGPFGRTVGLSELEVGAVFGSSAILFLLTSSFWGRLSDRTGRAPVMAGGLAASALSLFLFAGSYASHWTASLLGLLVARMIYGAFAAGIQPAAIAFMADTTTDSRRIADLASIGAAVGFGSIAGPILASVLVGFGLSAPVLVAGVVAAGAAVASLIGGWEAPPKPKPAMVAAAPVGGLVPYLLVALAMFGAFGALQPTMAFYMLDRFQLETEAAVRQAGFASAAFAGGSFVLQAFVIRKLPLGAHGMLVAGLTICLIGVAGCLVASRAGLLIAGFGLFGIGYGLAHSGLTAAVSILGGARQQGQFAGRLQAAMSGAWIAGALAGTAAYAVSILAPLLLALVAMTFAQTFAVHLLRRFSP